MFDRVENGVVYIKRLEGHWNVDGFNAEGVVVDADNTPEKARHWERYRRIRDVEIAKVMLRKATAAGPVLWQAERKLEETTAKLDEFEAATRCEVFTP